MNKPKFNKGEFLRCIPLHQIEEGGITGSGYIEGKIFKVKEITNNNGPDTVYWPTHENGFHSGLGIYERAVELVSKELPIFN